MALEKQIQEKKDRIAKEKEYERQLELREISRFENNASNVTIDTLVKVFTALKAKVKLQVELPNAKFNVTRSNHSQQSISYK